MAPSPLDDENAPLYTVGQVAQMLAVKQAFLRRVDELRVVSPQRSAGGQRRYTRYEIRVIQQVVSLTRASRCRRSAASSSWRGSSPR